MSVPEYDHSSKYWDNFRDMKKLCVDKGLYKQMGDRKYCGDLIKDS